MKRLLLLFFLGTILTACPGQTSSGGDATGLLVSLLGASQSPGTGTGTGTVGESATGEVIVGGCGIYDAGSNRTDSSGLTTASNSWQTINYSRDGKNFFNHVTQVSGIGAGDKIVFKGGSVIDWQTVGAYTDTSCPIDKAATSVTASAYLDTTNHYSSIVATGSTDAAFSITAECSSADCHNSPSGMQVVIQKFGCLTTQAAFQAWNMGGAGMRTYTLWYGGTGCNGTSIPVNSGNPLNWTLSSPIQCIAPGSYWVQSNATCTAGPTAVSAAKTYVFKQTSSSGYVFAENVYKNL